MKYNTAHFIRDFCISLTLWVCRNFTNTPLINTHDASSAVSQRQLIWVGLHLYGARCILCFSSILSLNYDDSFPFCIRCFFLLSLVFTWEAGNNLYLLYRKFSQSNSLQYYIWVFLSNSYLNNSYITIG